MERYLAHGAEAIVGAVAGAAVTAGAARTPRRRRLAALTAAAVVSAEAVYHPARLAVRGYRVSAAEPFRESARTALGAALLSLRELPGVTDASLGLQVYVVQLRLLPPRTLYLGRMAELRLGHRPGRSGIVWTAGKGVIGHCLATGSVTALRSEAAYAPYLGAGPQAWLRAPAEVTLGLSHSELMRIGRRYAGAVAVPIRTPDISGPEVRGVLSVDVLPGHDLGPLLKDEALEVMAATAEEVGAALSAVPAFVFHVPRRRHGWANLARSAAEEAGDGR